jgi:hypothetical protein
MGLLGSPLKISFFVGDEVTSLKFLRFLKDKLETPYVVSYFLNRLPAVVSLQVASLLQ